jgi:hypothetical protein
MGALVSLVNYLTLPQTTANIGRAIRQNIADPTEWGGRLGFYISTERSSSIYRQAMGREPSGWSEHRMHSPQCGVKDIFKLFLMLDMIP